MTVDTEWVAEHANDPGVRVVEVDVATSAYEEGHIPGAIAWNWTTQLCDTVRRDIIPKDQFERLMATRVSAMTPRSSSTATTTTGSPPGPFGR